MLFTSNHKLGNGANPRHYSLSIRKIQRTQSCTQFHITTATKSTIYNVLRLQAKESNFCRQPPVMFIKLEEQQNSFWFQSNTIIILFYPDDDMLRLLDHHQAIFTKLRIRYTSALL